MSEPIEVFYSYAHADEKLRDQLNKHLSLLQREGRIAGWHDRLIAVGTEWAGEIDEHLNSASVILLLVSADFLASDYCYDVELKRAMERHEAGEATVIPIILRPCDWHSAPFGKIQGAPKNAKAVTTWSNRDEAFLDIAKSIRKAVDKLTLGGLPQDVAGRSPGRKCRHWNVPYRENPHFVGRGPVLEEIHGRLNESHSMVVGQAIRGLGGIGKTETAVAYAHRFKDEYESVFWVRSDTEAEVQQGIADIHVLLWPVVETQSSQETIDRVLLWLQQQSNWLLIFDNADTPNILKPYLPLDHTGHILLTSRANTFRGLGIADPIELPVLDTSDAVKFLLKSAGRVESSDEEKEAATVIAEELDGLPLALEQAASYVEQGATFSDYLRSYRRQSVPWLEKSTAESRGYPDSVATTWKLNFDSVGEASADLLRFTAFLSPNEIPFELLSLGSSELGPNLDEALEGSDSEPLKINELLNPLAKYSLIDVYPESRVYSIHRLVQEVTKHEMGANNRRDWRQRSLRAVNRAFPDPEFPNWSQCKRLAAHADVIAKNVSEAGIATEEAGRICACLGSYLYSQGQYGIAEPLQKQSMEIRRIALGENHSDFANSLNNLAGMYHEMGRYDEAEPLYKQSLEILRSALGDTHSDFADSLNNLASLCDSMGRYEEAEPLYKQSLEISRSALGEDHPDFARCLGNLAGLYDSMERYDEAEPLCSQTVEIFRTLGEDSPDFANSLNNLAGLYYAMERYEEAEPLYKQSLEIRRTTLGEDHPDFAKSLGNLAGLYCAMGCYDKSEPLYKQTMEILRTALGEDHPDFATSLNNLALLYNLMGRYDDAEPLYKQSLEIRRTALGADHPDFADSVDKLASLYQALGRCDEAESLCRGALSNSPPTSDK